jgi:hypothetical protein
MKNYVIKVRGDNIHLDVLEAQPEGDLDLATMRESIRPPEAKSAPYVQRIALHQGEMYVDEDGGLKGNLPPNPIATMLYWMTHGMNRVGSRVIVGDALLRVNDDIDIHRLGEEIEEFRAAHAPASA